MKSSDGYFWQSQGAGTGGGPHQLKGPHIGFQRQGQGLGQ